MKVFSCQLFSLFSILSEEIQDDSVQTDIIISAVFTTILYSIQLFLSIKNFRQNMNQLYVQCSADHNSIKNLKRREIIRRSTQYPSYLLLYLFGGYFLCFHLILFVYEIGKQLFFIPTKALKLEAMIRYILPILVFYFLQKIGIHILYKIFYYFDKRDYGENRSAQYVPNIKLNILDSILLYLKLISCRKSIDCLLKNTIHSNFSRRFYRCYCIDHSFVL